MATRQSPAGDRPGHATVRRRGILVAAGAVVAGIMAKQTAQPVVATSGGGDQGVLALGSNPWYIAPSNPLNTPAVSSAPTVIHASPNFGNFLGTNGARPTIFAVDATPATGSINAIEAFAQGLGDGVYGYSRIGRGVHGESSGGPGVYGQSSSSYGVAGSSTSGTAVTGYAASGIGVEGTSTNNHGVYGFAYGAGTTFITAGVYGDSNATYGVVGRTTAPGYSGLTAITGTAGVAALAATSTVPGAYAAYFSGTTVVQGDFVAFGGTKSAAVPDATGQHRLVYCVESPEAWFEDFGTGTLVNGKAMVNLDKTFTQIVHTNDYHVFLTPYDGVGGLRAARRTATGFTVEEIAGASSGAFSYRVVAKRKDITGERLAKFDLPKIKHPDPDKLPKPEPIPPSPPRKP